MSELQRVRKIVNWLIFIGFGENEKEVAENMGYTKSSFSQILNGKVPLSDRFLNRLASAHEDINIGWIRTGDGPMFGREPESEAMPMDAPKVFMVPLISKYAYAGYVCGYGDAEYMDMLPTIPFIIPEEYAAKGEYRAFEVKGDSMDNGTDESIKDGDMLLCRLIRPELWMDYKLHIRKWNFVIVHKEGVLIKRIVDHDLDRGVITLRSLNELYPEQKVSLNDVRQIFNVVQLQRRPVL